jgi:hypothetical protein
MRAPVSLVRVVIVEPAPFKTPYEPPLIAPELVIVVMIIPELSRPAP